MTLVEILVATAIASMLLLPVGAWMTLAITQQAPTAGRFNDAAQSRILETMLTRDVASAELVTTGPTGTPPVQLQDCGASKADATVKPALNVFELGTEPATLVVYGTAAGGDGGFSLYRWECGAAAGTDGPPSKSFEVARGLDTEIDGTGTDVPKVEVTCASTTPPPKSLCKTVVLTASLESEEAAVAKVTASVRAEPVAITGAGLGFRPFASIKETSRDARTKTDPFKIHFTGVGSDLDGSIVSWQWEADGASDAVDPHSQNPTFKWSAAGEYGVTLTVTDDEGNSETVSETVELVNQPPEFLSTSVTAPNGDMVGVAGVTEYTLVADADDPDGTDPDSLPDGVVWKLDGAEIQSPYKFPPTATGQQNLEVVATDTEGATTTATVSVKLGPASPGSTKISPAPELSGTPPYIVASTGDLPVTFSFDQDPGFTRWELLDSGGATVATSTEPSFTHTFPDGVGGVFTIRRVRSTGDPAEIEDDFRIDRPPVAAFTFAPPGSVPATVAFDDQSSDDKGIASWSWNLGFTGWTSTEREPTRQYLNPGTYLVTLTVTEAGPKGRTTTKAASLVVPGAPSVPPPPGWSGSNVVWEPIPGVTRYRVSTTFTGKNADGTDCLRSGVTTERGAEGPYTSPGGTNSCAVPSQTLATMAVQANDTWSAASSPSVKP